MKSIVEGTGSKGVIVSATGRSETFDYLSELGQLKLLSRLVRFGQVLSWQEYKVLLAIYDRTYAWRRSEAVIRDRDFLDGVPRGRTRFDAAPIGLSQVELSCALDELVQRGAIRRFGRPLPITYAINVDWQPSGFRHMWAVDEGDYRYRSVDE